LRIVARLKARPRAIPARSPFDKRQAGTLHGDLSARSHGDADIRFGERRGIIDPIAGHGDDAALALQTPHDRILLIGQYIGFHVGDVKFCGNRLCRRAMVPGQHHDAQPLAAQRVERRRRRRFDRIGHGDDARELLIHDHEHRGGAFLPQDLRTRFKLGALDLKICKQGKIADRHAPAADGARDALAGDGGKVRDVTERQLPCVSCGKNRRGEGMLARFLQACPEGKHGGFVKPRGGHDRRHSRLTLCECPRLIDD
jgi:hypothetical protein